MFKSKQLCNLCAGALLLAVTGATSARADDWTGLHAGVHLGWGWGDQKTKVLTGLPTFPAGFVRERDLDGFIAGAHLGFDQEFAQFIVGVEADYDWSDVDGADSVVSPLIMGGGINRTKTDMEWIATLTARIGMPVNILDQELLPYIRAGAAWAHFETSGTQFNADGAVVTTNRANDTHQGWLIGAGAELAIMHNIAARLEYDYIDFGDHNVAGTSGLGVRHRRFDRDLHLVKVGVVFRFGGDSNEE